MNKVSTKYTQALQTIKFIEVADAMLSLPSTTSIVADILVLLDTTIYNTRNVGMLLSARYKQLPDVVVRERLPRTNALNGSYTYGINADEYAAFKSEFLEYWNSLPENTTNKQEAA
jgi:hypothetical protein